MSKANAQPRPGALTEPPAPSTLRSPRPISPPAPAPIPPRLARIRPVASAPSRGDHPRRADERIDHPPLRSRLSIAPLLGLVLRARVRLHRFIRRSLRRLPRVLRRPDRTLPARRRASPKFHHRQTLADDPSDHADATQCHTHDRFPWEFVRYARAPVARFAATIPQGTAPFEEPTRSVAPIPLPPLPSVFPWEGRLTPSHRPLIPAFPSRLPPFPDPLHEFFRKSTVLLLGHFGEFAVRPAAPDRLPAFFDRLPVLPDSSPAFFNFARGFSAGSRPCARASRSRRLASCSSRIASPLFSTSTGRAASPLWVSRSPSVAPRSVTRFSRAAPPLCPARPVLRRPRPDLHARSPSLLSGLPPLLSEQTVLNQDNCTQ